MMILLNCDKKDEGRRDGGRFRRRWFG